MCGRIAQSRAVADYLETIAWNSYSLPDVLGPRYNVPPGTHPLAIHCLGGEPEVTRLFWGYKPAWAKQPISNARVDTMLDPTKKTWRNAFEHGRILVPADGWYEWTGEKGSKQPWFIHSEGDEPIMMAAICAWRPGAETYAEHGMAIVTDDSAGGWSTFTIAAQSCCRRHLRASGQTRPPPQNRHARLSPQPSPPEAFRWQQVTPEVGSSKYQLPDALAKLRKS